MDKPQDSQKQLINYGTNRKKGNTHTQPRKIKNTFAKKFVCQRAQKTSKACKIH